MAEHTHTYRTHLRWSGADPAVPFRRHRREYIINADGKPQIEGSSDAVFRGDATRWNPEDLLVASLSACHQLWYLGLCAASGLEVLAYEDTAEGTMVEETTGGAGQFTKVVLRPIVTLAAGADTDKAHALHEVAHGKCFIARSVNFPVCVEPTVTRQPANTSSPSG